MLVFVRALLVREALPLQPLQSHKQLQDAIGLR
jgi:hypothetical protein